MNKAFTREPDAGETRCPRCESPGTPVGPETLRARLLPDALDKLAESGFFCRYEWCDVVYFDQFGRTVDSSSLRAPIYPKDPTAPICACFEFTRDDIEQDVQEGGATRTRALLAKAKSPEACCAVRAGDGQSCVPEVQRYFMKCRAREQGAQS